MKQHKLLFILLLLFSIPGLSYSFPKANPVPGGVAIVDLGKHYSEGTKVYFYKNRVLVRKNEHRWEAVIGIPLKAKKGTHKLELKNKGKTSFVEFKILPKDYATRHITIKNKRMVSPTKKDIDRHFKEKPLIVAALKQWTDSNDIQTQFTLPVSGPFSSPFGLRRIYNNQKRIRRHTGLDIAAPTGTEIRSPAKGKVIRTGNYFFTGGTVFIDHGQGLVTMYCHLDSIEVTAGQSLMQNQRIGTVGKTGRVSGAHLHWVVSLNNTKVDPKLFLAEELN